MLPGCALLLKNNIEHNKDGVSCPKILINEYIDIENLTIAVFTVSFAINKAQYAFESLSRYFDVIQ